MAEQTPTGHFRLLYFAAASDYTKTPFDEIFAPLPLKALFTTLEDKYPGIIERILSSSAVTLNLEYVDMQQDPDNAVSDIIIHAGDEVAIIPPVSSG